LRVPWRAEDRRGPGIGVGSREFLGRDGESVALCGFGVLLKKGALCLRVAALDAAMN